MRESGHQTGPQCKCSECKKLLRTENKWILRLGTFYGSTGLNTRDEVKSDVRGNFKTWSSKIRKRFPALSLSWILSILKICNMLPRLWLFVYVSFNCQYCDISSNFHFLILSVILVSLQRKVKIKNEMFKLLKSFLLDGKS